MHPLVTLVKGSRLSIVGKEIGVDRTSINSYYQRALKNRDALVPAGWALPLAELTGLHPSVFRPDLYPKTGVPPL